MLPFYPLQNSSSYMSSMRSSTESFLPACGVHDKAHNCYTKVTVYLFCIKTHTSRTCKKVKVFHLRLTVKTAWISALPPKIHKWSLTWLLWASNPSQAFADTLFLKGTYLSSSAGNSIDHCPRETVFYRTCCLHRIEIASFLNQHIIRYSHTGEL